MLTKQIDFTTLEEQVMEKWIDDGVEFEEQELLSNDPVPYYETRIIDRYADILDDPMACIAELGYDSIASYISAERDAEEVDRVTYEPNINLDEIDGKTLPVAKNPIGITSMTFSVVKPRVIFMSGVLSKKFREAACEK